MKKSIIATLCVPVIAIAGSAFGQLAPAPVPPPIVSASGDITSTVLGGGQKLIGWRTGVTTCSGVSQEPVSLPSPGDWLGWVPDRNDRPKPVMVEFSIDAAGHPHAIKQIGAEYAPFSSNIVPSLAAATFKPGAARSGCTLTYSPDPVAVDAAPVERLIGYSVAPLGQRLPKSGYDRVRAVAFPQSTCADPQPVVRNRAYPDFTAIPQAPGTRSWSMIGYDIDRLGRPVGVRVFRSTGNAALDRASIKAVRASRFAPVARHGCLYPYWRTGGTVAAPAIPDALADENSPTCPVSQQWATQPVVRYPEAYRRHGIEGWAVIGYDVAPWGSAGNIHIVASEPATEFGVAAIQAVRAAMKEPSPQGYTGCMARVRFVIADPGKEPADEVKFERGR